MFMGHYCKAFAVYSEPFWRKKGFSGEVMISGENSAFSFIYDSSSPDEKFFALVAFVGGRNSINFQKVSIFFSFLFFFLFEFNYFILFILFEPQHFFFIP